MELISSFCFHLPNLYVYAIDNVLGKKSVKRFTRDKWRTIRARVTGGSGRPIAVPHAINPLISFRTIRSGCISFVYESKWWIRVRLMVFRDLPLWHEGQHEVARVTAQFRTLPHEYVTKSVVFEIRFYLSKSRFIFIIWQISGSDGHNAAFLTQLFY